MDRKRLVRLRRRLEAFRHTQPKAVALNALAKAFGRKDVSRGKEPTFISETFPQLRPLSIPMHKGRDLPTGTKNSILNQLEDDLIAWDETLSSNESLNGDQRKGDKLGG